MTKIFILVIVALVMALLFTTQYALRQSRERERVEHNQEILLEENQREYRVRDSLNARSVEELTLKLSEFKRYFGELAGLINSVGVRVKRVESVQQSAVESHYQIETPLIDTTVRIVETIESGYEESVEWGGRETKGESEAVITTQAILYKTPHITIDGVIFGSTFRGAITTYDTLTQIVHRVPKRFLFIRWGTKELRQEIVSSNPHSRITYSREVKIDRSRKTKR